MILRNEETDKPLNEGRAHVRSSIFLAAVLQAGRDRAPVKVRNMSPYGAMIETPVAPPAGTLVELVRGSLVAQGTVIWSNANRCGLRFLSEVAVADWLASPAKPQQARVDEVVARFKSGTAGVSSGPPGQEAVAPGPLVNDLAAVLQLLQALEDDLAASDETLARHGIKLQNLDIAMQMVRAISRELAPTDGEPIEKLAKLKDLRVTCAQALGTG